MYQKGKKEFYPKAEHALKSQGYQYYDGDRDIRGKDRAHSSKPDYIATKGDSIIIGEIKSPKEGPNSSSWNLTTAKTLNPLELRSKEERKKKKFPERLAAMK